MIEIIQRQRWSEYTRYLIVGRYCSISLDLFDTFHSSFGGTAFVHGLWVDEIKRRKGYATTILDTAEKIARRAGHKSVFLEWHGADTPEFVLQWYMRRGYNVREREDDYTLLEKTL